MVSTRTFVWMYLPWCGGTGLPINLLGHGEPLCKVALLCGLYGQLFVQGENRGLFHFLCVFEGLKQRNGIWAQTRCDESHLQLLRGFFFFFPVGAWFMMAQKWGCTIGDADVSINVTLKDKITNKRVSFNKHFLSPSVCQALLDVLGV